MSGPDFDLDRPELPRDEDLAAEVGSPFAPSPEYFRPPRLGIIHLLAWTGVTAVLLKFLMAMEMVSPRTGDLSVAWQIVGDANRVVTSALLGAGIVGVAVIFRAKSRGEAGRLQPGHWLVLLCTLATVGSWLARAVLTITLQESQHDPDFLPYTYLLVLGIFSMAVAIGFLLVGRSLHDARRWKLSFRIVGITAMLRSCLELIDVVTRTVFAVAGQAVWSLVVGMVLALTALLDLHRGTRRDWVHWLGIAVVVGRAFFFFVSCMLFIVLRVMGM